MPSNQNNRCETLSVRDYGVVGGLADETAAVRTAIAAAKAAAPCVLDFAGLDLKIDVVSIAGLDGVILRGNGATIRPLQASGSDGKQTTGRFAGLNFGFITFEGFRFVQTPGYHYEAAIDISVGTSATFLNNIFLGCGFGIRVQQVNRVYREGNIYRQVGIAPRPAPLDPTGAGYNAAFEIYGGGFRAVDCRAVLGGDGEDFANDTPASGYTSDVTGGAGAFTTYVCDDVRLSGRAINAPGQGFGAAGDMQGQDVVGMLIAGNYNSNFRGQRITFDNCIAQGCNQEGLRARLEKDSIWFWPVIQARDVDRAEPWPDGQDRQEDEALPV